MKNLMKTIKPWLSFILTFLLIVILFAVIFVRLGLVQLSTSFFLELGVVVMITIQTRYWWWNNTEDRRLTEQDIVDSKKQYYTNVDTTIDDITKLEKFLIILNRDNRENYIKNKIGSRNKDNIKLNWIDKKIKKISQEDKFNKLYFKYQRKADKLKEIKASEITSLTGTILLYDSNNYLKTKKRAFHIGMSIISVILTVFLASIALKEILLNWQNVFRFVFYLFAIVWTIGSTIFTAYRTTGNETIDHISRLQIILDKYESYKKQQGGVINGNTNSNSVGLPSTIIRPAESVSDSDGLV